MGEMVTIEQTTTCGFCGRTVSVANKAEWAKHVKECDQHPARQYRVAIYRAHALLVNLIERDPKCHVGESITIDEVLEILKDAM